MKKIVAVVVAAAFALMAGGAPARAETPPPNAGELCVMMMQAEAEAHALGFCRDAVAEGDPWGMVLLGRIYAGGRVVDEDPTFAFELFQSAARMGLPEGMVNAAVCWLKGYGVPAASDYEGFVWLLIAAAMEKDAGINGGTAQQLRDALTATLTLDEVLAATKEAHLRIEAIAKVQAGMEARRQ